MDQDSQAPFSVMYVCMANISRSRAGEFCLRHLAKERGVGQSVHIASCGIGSTSPGYPPNAMLKKYFMENYEIEIAGDSKIFDPAFFYVYDLILASDLYVLKNLEQIQPVDSTSKVYLMTHYLSQTPDIEVHGPYTASDLPQTAKLIYDSCQSVMDFIQGVVA